MSHFLTCDDIQYICYEYAKTHLAYDEPLPSFATRYPGKLEATLASPQTQIGGSFVHSSLPQQAAVLFYEMNKQHPFLNGNKRIACVSLMVFLSLNDKWLKTDWKELYDISVTVAASKSENRGGILKLLKEFILNNIIEQ